MSITIKVVSAQLTRDTEFFSNMDPYCIVRLGSQSQRTKTKSQAGKKPVWNESFRFSQQDNNLKVIIMDEDNVADDLVGEGQVDITRFRNSANEQEQIVQLYFQGKAAGKIMLKISGGTGQQGNNFNQQGNSWGNSQSNNYGGGQQQWGGQQPQQQWGNNQPQQQQWGGQQQQQWGGQQPQPQPNQGWNNQNQNTGWNQQGQGQGGNQWSNPNVPNQPPQNMNNFNPLLQGIVQNNWGQPNGQNTQGGWGQPGNQNQQNNQWGGQKPNSQWGNPQQGPNMNQNQNANQGWGNPQVPPKPNNQVVYPDLEYRPPGINNPQTNPQQDPNMNVPFQLIGGMQGLFGKQPNNNQGGNPYVT